MDLTSHPSQTAVFIKLFPGLARIQFQHVGIPTRDLDWMWGRIQFKRLSGLMMQVSDGFLVWSSIFCSGWRISFQNVYMGWLLPTSVTSVGEYMGLGDGCCQHPSPLLVNTWNTWAWVTDVANIHHLCWWIHGIHGLGWRILPTSVTSVGEYVCWSNIAWVTDSADIRHLCWWMHGIHGLGWRMLAASVTSCGQTLPGWRILPTTLYVCVCFSKFLMWKASAEVTDWDDVQHPEYWGDVWLHLHENDTPSQYQ